MAFWWKRSLPVEGRVVFPGELPPQAEEFAFLEKLGIAVKPRSGNTRSQWVLELTHPQWGTAELGCHPEIPLLPGFVYEYSFIPSADRDAAIAARSIVAFRMKSQHEHMLRDRKTMLRFLRAVMGSDGVVCIDMVAHKVWTREDLDDELSHDADLDVEGIYNIDAVTDEGDGAVHWVHTHGLAEIGAFDFDIIDPSEDVMSGLQDLFRSLAFGALEGELQPSMPEFMLLPPSGKVRLVPMKLFLANAAPQLRERLTGGTDDWHTRDRSVLCEPESSSIIGRLLGRGKQSIRPSRLLSGSIPENPVLGFSTNASSLMAERALKTYPLLRKLRTEFAEFPFACLVKLGIETDDKNSKEHLWFEAHELLDDSIEGTLVNQPYYVSRLKEGDRGSHPIDLISDWTVFTPLGMMTPRSTTVARMVRANAEELRRTLKETEQSG